MECYLLYKSFEETVESVTFDVSFSSTKTVYFVNTSTIDSWVTKFKVSLEKFFVQGCIPIDYKDNGLYKSLFNNLPLAWIQFAFQNEGHILRISQDLELISKNDLVLPSVQDVFKVLHILKPKKVKAIIVGQDPYPQKNIADGIAFSTLTNSLPASLKNIYKELDEYEGIKVDTSTSDLTRWVNQGCLLINSAWTVSENKVGSHSNLWKGLVENFLRYILEMNSTKKIPIAFFGADAKTKFQNSLKSYPNAIFLTTCHPSPQSADKGFFNSQIFHKINEYLDEQIDWS